MTEREIFTAALAREDRAQRAAFLDEACAGDAALRQRVESLVAEHQQLGSFMDVPSQAVAKTIDIHGAPLVAERAGTIIGPYKLLQQIGEGGMGVVYMAEQAAPVRRKVALKIIKPGMDSREVIARFEAERQALALMDHPNIARVFDGGATEAGRPYFVMELVRGVPITDYCDQNNLPVHERLELFVTVCHAVQHAHQKGIIHRDIKPSNVLVTMHDGQPVPKVIDFGVAKAIGQQLTDKTLFTEFAQMVGTPLYMSPEQAELTGLDIDTRGDIYSLGVLLYELLTGTTPFERGRMKQAALDEIRRMIREEDPPSPSTRLSSTAGKAQTAVAAHRRVDPRGLSRLVRGDLDWIVMKALEKDRNRRYETANGFAADIGRYLSDEPVEACPPSAAYRFRKFARRNKRALAGAALLGLALFVAVGAVAGSFGWVVRDRNARLVKTAGEVEQFLKQADSLYEDNKLPEALAEVEKAQGLLEAGGGDEALRQQVRQWRADLETAIRLEEMRLESLDQVEREQIYADHARAFREYGIDVEVLPTEEAVARVAASRIKLDMVLTLTNWATYLRYDSRPQETTLWERLRSISRTVDPDPWRLRLLEAAEAKNLEALRELAEAADPGRQRTSTLAFLGNSLNLAGDPDGAIAFVRKVQRRHPADFSINSSLANCLATLKSPPWDEVIGFQRAAVAVRPRSAAARSDLGYWLYQHGRPDEAIAEYHAAIRLKPDYALAHNNLGVAVEKTAVDEAIAEYREAIRLDPDRVLFRNNLAARLADKGLHAEAIACYRGAIERDPKSAEAHRGLGDALKQEGRLDEAIAAYNEAIVEYRAAIAFDPMLDMAHANLGKALGKKGLLDEAITEFREAIRLKPDSPAYHNCLGSTLFSQNRLDEAIAEYRKAIELDPKSAGGHYELGRALQRQGLLDEALAEYRQAIECDPKFAEAHYSLGNALKEKGLLDEAIAEYREPIRLKPDDAGYHKNLANFLSANGKLDDAVTEYREAIRLRPDFAAAHYGLGNVFKEKGLVDEAIAEYREPIRLKPDDAGYHRNLAGFLSGLGKLDDAVTEYREAIRLKADFAAAHDDLGIALQKKGLPDEAIAAYRKAIELSPKFVAAHFNLGCTLLAQGNLDEAITAFRRTIELAPKYADAHSALANALSVRAQQLTIAKAGDTIRAAELAKEAIELQPQSEWHWQWLGWAHYRGGDWKASVAALEKSCELQKGGQAGQWVVMSLAHEKLANENDLAEEERIRHKAEAHRLYREAVKQINNWGSENSTTQAIRAFRAEAAELLGVNQAIKSLEMLVAAQPDAWEPRVKLAQSYAEEGLSEKAAAEYTKATELKPDASEAWSGRAFVHFHRQQWDEAIADFSRAIELVPQVHTNWWHRGHSFLASQQWDKAAADFGYVIDHWPDGAEGWYLHAIALAQMNEPDKALANLRQAIALGFRNVEQIRNDPHFSALRAHDGFGKLLEELEQKQKSKDK